MLPPCACTPPASSCPLAAILNGPIRRNQNHWMSPWLIASSLAGDVQPCLFWTAHSIWSMLFWHFPTKLVIKPLILSLQYLLYNHNMWSYIDSPFSISYKCIQYGFVAGHDGSSKAEVIENSLLNPPWKTLTIITKVQNASCIHVRRLHWRQLSVPTSLTISRKFMPKHGTDSLTAALSLQP